MTSTSEVYGTAQFVPITELHPRQPQSPYSASKIGADCIAESFYRSFNLPVTIVRPFNTYGPRQSARAVIPTIITQLLNNAKSLKLGDTTPTRDLLFVKDTARAFAEIAKTEQLIGQDVNICTESEISIQELAELIMKLTGKTAEIEQDDERLRPVKSEVFRLFGDSKKLRSHTFWLPEYSIEKGLEKTIEWFSDAKNLSLYKSDIYNL